MSERMDEAAAASRLMEMAIAHWAGELLLQAAEMGLIRPILVGPGRLADRAPRLLRRGVASRGGATPGCIQGDRMILLLASRHKTE